MGPYCLKVETYLRMADIPHRVEVGDLRTAPRGQLPWADVAGSRVGDSELILAALRPLARRPVPEDPGARPIVRLLEESTVWALRHARFVEDEGWADTAKLCAAMFPAALRWIGPSLVRRAMRQALHGQGTGRHPREQIYAFAAADLDSIVSYLGDRPFVGGGTPSVADATVFGFTANFLCEHARSPLTDLAASRPALVAYNERMRERFFPEYPAWIGQRFDLAA
jgi:glutathione S-transferase